VLTFRPNCYEAYWARAKARKELNLSHEALADLREAIKLSPQNMELHRFTMQVKAEIEAAAVKSSDQSSKSHLRLDLVSSTPKKEIESEV